MQDWQDMICDFHKSKGFNINTYKIGIDKPSWWILQLLKICGYSMYGIGKIISGIDKLAKYFHCRHWLIFRCHIIIEEVAETIIGIAKGDEIEVADGIGDSIVVLLSLAVICNLPMDSVLKEIQKSNMSKGFGDDIGGRIKGLYKGEDYYPPNIKKAIVIGRLVGNGSGTE